MFLCISKYLLYSNIIKKFNFKSLILSSFDNPSTSDYCRPCNIKSGDPPSNHSTVIPDDDDELFGRKYECGLTFRGKPGMQTVIQAFSSENSKSKQNKIK